MRGLKQGTAFGGKTGAGVAPPAGAWIETLMDIKRANLLQVAPPAGAWIETYFLSPFAPPLTVAPPAGAWIETLIFPLA
mgnify:CR=1 FL=1